jgi:nicotinamidase/pyrazinamidase
MGAMGPKLTQEDAVLVVDFQNDFCPGGALPVPDGDQILTTVNEWVGAAQRARSTVAASLDWHPPDHISFHERGGPWPRHCVQNTPGAELHPRVELPFKSIIVRKGADPHRDAYSAFDQTGLADELRQRGTRRLWVCGLAQDVCVKASVLDALKEGFEVHVLKAGTRPVDPAQGEGALSAMREAGALIEP